MIELRSNVIFQVEAEDCSTLQDPCLDCVVLLNFHSILDTGTFFFFFLVITLAVL